MVKGARVGWHPSQCRMAMITGLSGADPCSEGGLEHLLAEDGRTRPENPVGSRAIFP
jgi:hypothetical protein